MDNYIDITPQQWRRVLDSVYDLRVHLARKTAAFKGRYFPDGQECALWDNFDRKLSYPSIVNQNKVVLNVYNDPRGKGGITKDGRGASKSSDVYSDVICFNYDGHKVRASSLRTRIASYEDMFVVMEHLTGCRNNVMQFKDNIEKSIEDAVKEISEPRIPIFEPVHILDDGKGVKHCFFDRRNVVLENRLMHEDDVVVHDKDPDVFNGIVESISKGSYDSDDGRIPSYVTKYYNGLELVTFGELASDISPRFDYIRRDELKVEMAVKSLNDTAVYLAAKAVGLESGEYVTEGFVPENGMLISYAKGGTPRMWNSRTNIFEGVTCHNGKVGFYSDNAHGFHNTRNALMSAAEKLFSDENIIRVGSDLKNFSRSEKKTPKV